MQFSLCINYDLYSTTYSIIIIYIIIIYNKRLINVLYVYR